jgi:hypothetical protein
MKLQYQSPFPGFDPYVQWRWESFHVHMIVTLRDSMRGRLPEGLRPRIESRVLLDHTRAAGDIVRRKMKADTMVVEYPRSYPAAGLSQMDSTTFREDSEPAVAEPVTITLIEEEVTERFIQIVDVKDNDRVVTTLEILSLANKTPGGGREEFIGKQAENWQAGVSLVELDFIRGGRHALALPMSFEHTDPSVVYRVGIITGWRHGTGQIYPIKLSQRLPVISVPLRRTDEPLTIDLQQIHDITYDRAECALDIDYRNEPEPPLNPTDATWANALLKAKGLR